MRRSSCIALVFAAVMLAALAVLFTVPQDSQADGMDGKTANAFLAAGCRMLARGDTDAILNLFADDGMVLGVPPDRMRAPLATAIQDMHGRPLLAAWRNLSVKPSGDEAFLTFDVDVDEKRGEVAIHYFTSHVNLTLKKTATSHLLGLYRKTEWKISQFAADPPFGVTDP